MAYGHADKIAAITAGTPAAGREKPAPPIDPALYRRDNVRRILAERDIGALFRVLKDDAGLTQRSIAELIGMAQSEVSEILGGRQVKQVDVLERICDGLGIPRELMGLGYGERGAYPEVATVAEPTPEGVSAEMLRRHVIALGAIAAVGTPTVGELLTELGNPSPVPMPTRLSGVHVAQVRDLTRRLSEAAMTSGSDPDVSSAAAAWATRRLDVPGIETVKQALMTAVAELHAVAGWAGFETGLYDRAMFHYARALELATEVGDAYLETLALNCAGLATVEHGQPDDGLKILQLAQFKAWDIPDNERGTVLVLGLRSRAALEACAGADSASAYYRLECPEAADRALAKARELWQPTRTDPGGDLDRPAAVLELERGRLDAAESFAAASVRRWEGGGQVSRLVSFLGVGSTSAPAWMGSPSGTSVTGHAIGGQASDQANWWARPESATTVDRSKARHVAAARSLASHTGSPTPPSAWRSSTQEHHSDTHRSWARGVDRDRRIGISAGA